MTGVHEDFPFTLCVPHYIDLSILVCLTLKHPPLSCYLRPQILGGPTLTIITGTMLSIVKEVSTKNRVGLLRSMSTIRYSEYGHPYNVLK
jgi:hypothetical protein